MGFLVDLIREYGLGVVFLNVLIEQLGAPIPAYPVLVVTGAVAGDDWQHGARIVLLAVAAARSLPTCCGTRPASPTAIVCWGASAAFRCRPMPASARRNRSTAAGAPSRC